MNIECIDSESSVIVAAHYKTPGYYRCTCDSINFHWYSELMCKINSYQGMYLMTVDAQNWSRMSAGAGTWSF